LHFAFTEQHSQQQQQHSQHQQQHQHSQQQQQQLQQQHAQQQFGVVDSSNGSSNDIRFVFERCVERNPVKKINRNLVIY